MAAFTEDFLLGCMKLPADDITKGLSTPRAGSRSGSTSTEMISVVDLHKVSDQALVKYTHILQQQGEQIEWGILERMYHLKIPFVSEDWVRAGLQGELGTVKQGALHGNGVFIGQNGNSSGISDVLKSLIVYLDGEINSQLNTKTKYYIKLDDNDHMVDVIGDFNKRSDVKIDIVGIEWIWDQLAKERRKRELLYEQQETAQHLSLREAIANGWQNGVSVDVNMNDKCKRLLETILEKFNVPKGDSFVITIQDRQNVPNKYRTIDWLWDRILMHEQNSLCHYPPPGLIFEGKSFSVSNYTGWSRTYIQLLIERMGGQFSKSFKRDSTNVLVCASSKGSKYRHALKWGVDVVTHEWIEDAYWGGSVPDIRRRSLMRDDDFDGRVIDSGEWIVQLNEKDDVSPEPVVVDLDSEEENELPAVEESELVGNDKKHELTAEEDLSPEYKKAKVQPVISSRRSSGGSADLLVLSDSPRKLHTAEEYSADSAVPVSETETESRRNESREISTNETYTLPHEENESAAASPAAPVSLVAIITGIDIVLTSAQKKHLKSRNITITETPTSARLNCIISPTLLRTEKFLKGMSRNPVWLLNERFLTDSLCDKADTVNALASQDGEETYSLWHDVDMDDLIARGIFSNGTTLEQAKQAMVAHDKKDTLAGCEFVTANDTLAGIVRCFGGKVCKTKRPDGRLKWDEIVLCLFGGHNLAAGVYEIVT